MDKNEILQKSREENASMDEWEKSVYATAHKWSVWCGGLLCMLIVLLESFFTDDVNTGLWAVYTTMTGISYLYVYAKLKKRKDIVYGVLYAVLAVAFLVLHILDLAVM